MKDTKQLLKYINILFIWSNCIFILIIISLIFILKHTDSKLDKINTNIDTINNTIVDLQDQLLTQQDDIQNTIYSIEVNSNYIDNISEYFSNKISEIQSNIDSISLDIDELQKSIEKLKSAKTEKSNTYLTNVISKDTNINGSYFQKVTNYYMMIPSTIRKDFENDGWKIYITSNKLEMQGISSRILALTNYNEKMIYISQYSASSIVHEIGHYVDYKNNYAYRGISNDMFEIEKNNLIKIDNTDSHNYIDELEYFAECFSMYILKHDLFKKSCPLTYEYLSNFI